MVQLRPWQVEAHDKAVNWLVEAGEDRHFLINAAPGSGKTMVSCAIADTLLRLGMIDRAVVIAPRTEVVNQWARDFALVTGRHMSKVTGQDLDLRSMRLDVCATWAAVSALEDAFQALCESARVLVICDEHHHAAVAAAWGETADSAFANAAYVLVLTGTPVRSDGAKAIWLPYNDLGSIEKPEAGSYTLTYGEAVDLGYCRPVTFHRHEGRFQVKLKDDLLLEVSNRTGAILPEEHAANRALQRSLDFFKLAGTPQYDEQGRPRLDGYQSSMMEWASQKLDDLRYLMSRAGGLVIAPSIEMAHYFADLIELQEGERPVLVHSQMQNAEARINAFRKTDARWIVSVAMISEGVDIPRLRVLVYLPSALTELAFRQAVGRVVRSAGPEDDTRAYVVMPAFGMLDEFARRVEDEMPESLRADTAVTTKRCPICRTACSRGDQECGACGHAFAVRVRNFLSCGACGMKNTTGAHDCQRCGSSFRHDFTLTLQEALRDGAITRGVDLSEEDLRYAETNARQVRDLVKRSGDASLIRVMRSVPDECLGRLRSILNEAGL
ncbi:MAG: DEAD/DEAH box helicase [Allosphingosinicella sp.]|uniref:DEAD/DEAH box helicase n=1 Tax=Allosphingosinicella sp. TaxID=2823234 RepID=UPI003929554D